MEFYLKPRSKEYLSAVRCSFPPTVEGQDFPKQLEWMSALGLMCCSDPNYLCDLLWRSVWKWWLIKIIFFHFTKKILDSAETMVFSQEAIEHLSNQIISLRSLLQDQTAAFNCGKAFVIHFMYIVQSTRTIDYKDGYHEVWRHLLESFVQRCSLGLALPLLFRARTLQ